MTNRITPPTSHPFKPGEAVYVLPSTHRFLSPAPRIHAVVVGDPYSMTRVQFDDGRQVCVNTSNLAYRGYCKRCCVPAVLERTRRGVPVCTCPICGEKAVNQPLPDIAVASLLPINEWRTPMVMLRSVLNPSWSYKMAMHDSSVTVDRTYQDMLVRLGLEKPRHRPNDLLWLANSRKIELLQFYAMIDHEGEFLSTYQDLVLEQMRTSGDGFVHSPRRLTLPSRTITIGAADYAFA